MDLSRKCQGCLVPPWCRVKAIHAFLERFRRGCPVIVEVWEDNN